MTPNLRPLLVWLARGGLKMAERLRAAGWREVYPGRWRHPNGGPLLGTLAADDARREEAQRGAER